MTGVFDSVADEVEEDLQEHGAIAEDFGEWGNFPNDISFCGGVFEIADGGRDELIERGGGRA